MMFYKETNFKETLIGKIPKDWDVAKLGDVSETIKGKKPTKFLDRKSENAIPYLTAEYMRSNSNVQWCKKDDPNIIQVNKNDLLMIWDGSYAGDVFIGFEGALASTMIKITPNETLDRKFLYYFLTTKFELLNGATSGTGIPHVSKSIFENLLVPIPPMSEQQRIAEILSTVDEAIQKTDEVIAKTERLKKGLMQELLTKGIGHKEFKDTEIGRIPKEWKVVRLKEVIFEAKSGFACGKRDENGILQLRMDNIETEGWINTQAGVKVPVPKNVEEYILKPGDILFNNTNSADLIGKTAIFRGEFSRCVYSNHLTRIRVNPNKVLPEWILYLFIRYWRRGIFRAICHQHVHQAGINKGDLLNLKIPIAPLKEQKDIIEMLLCADKKLKIEMKEKAKLERIKQGVMDLLLTGKIRVRVG